MGRYPAASLVRRAKPQEKIEDIDPQFWQARFRSWAQSSVVPVGSLLAALDSRSWVIREGPPRELVRLYREQLEFLKVQIAVRVKEAGGEWSNSALTVRSADGLTFTVHLPSA